ncbi:hypothetical protein NUG22_02675 [Saccharothrix longispora]|nr:hypothetical protein [Saccharothrix longispora]MDU0288095.1 hypothetical protein [Saccharothrix longispora]
MRRAKRGAGRPSRRSATCRHAITVGRRNSTTSWSTSDTRPPHRPCRVRRSPHPAPEVTSTRSQPASHAAVLDARDTTCHTRSGDAATHLPRTTSITRPS